MNEMNINKTRNKWMNKNKQFKCLFKKQKHKTNRRIWADNGDALSTSYAGTAALKSDVTRTGKSSYAGLFNDGVCVFCFLLMDSFFIYISFICFLFHLFHFLLHFFHFYLYLYFFHFVDLFLTYLFPFFLII